ncbi:MAG: caspase family protein [Bacteroidales bacterium]|nr:caspase family protein [Bacteroidales bacterium]
MKKITLLFTATLYFITIQAFAQQPEVSITTGHSGLIMRVAIAPAGNLVASNGADHLIKIWDKNSGKEITTLSNKVKGVDNEQRIDDLKFFDDGKHLLTSDENGSIKIWNIEKEKIVKDYESAGGMPGLTEDIAGKRIVFIDKNYLLAVTETNNPEIKTYSDFRIRIVKINPNNPNEVFVVDLQNNFFMFNIETGLKTTTFEKTDKYVFKVAISNNGKYLSIVFSDMTLKIWDIKTGNLIKEIKGIKPTNIYFHPITGEFVALIQDPIKFQNIIYVFDNKKFELKRKIENIGYFASFMDLSANGKLIALNSMVMKNNSSSYTINLIDWKTGKLIKILRSRAHSVWQIEAAINSPRIASLNGDLNLRIWNISTLQIEKVFKFIQKIAINTDGNILAVHGYHKEGPGYTCIALWDLDSMKIKSYLPVPDILSDLNFCADNEHIITSTLSSRISVWNIKSGKQIYTIQGDISGTQSAVISKDLKYIAYGSSGTGGVKIYDTNSKKTIKIEEAHKYLGASDLRFSSDGKYLLSGSFNSEVIAWKIGTWEKATDYLGNIGPVSCISYNFNNTETASGSMGSAVTETDYAVNVWNTETGKLKCKLLNHDLAVTSIAFNEKNHLLFSGSNDGTIKIWSLDSCKEIMSCIAIDYDDYIFVTPDYHYTGSKDALKGVGFKMNGVKLYPFEQYDLRLNRPDIIAERLNIAPQKMIDAFKRAYHKRLEKMGFNENILNNDFNLPQIELINKNEITFQSATNELLLEISAKDEKYILDRINIWINDVPLYGREGINLLSEKSKKINKKVKIFLSEGKNKIQISVLNSKGVESLKETIVTIAPSSNRKPDLYIVAVGVSDYINDEYDLNYAAKDANDLTDIFETKKNKFENIHIIKVLDHDATKENILKTKEELKNSNINDLVIIYTAGHGFLDDNLDYFFATTDIDVLNPSKNGLSYDELESLLEDIPARKKLLLMDACHSGEIDFDEYDLYVENMGNNVVARNIYVSKTSASHIGLDNSFRLMKELFADLRRGSGAVVISSAGGVEYAFESDELKNGVFTYVLINALKSMKANSNYDKVITISELQKYVMKTVSELTGGKQNPTTRRENLEFDFEIW